MFNNDFPIPVGRWGVKTLDEMAKSADEQSDPLDNALIPVGRGRILRTAAAVRKYEHHFEEKQRVRVRETGQSGLLESINRHQGYNVRLDSGHLIEARRDELEPEDFHGSAAPAKLTRAMALQDPFGLAPLPIVAGDSFLKVDGESCRDRFCVSEMSATLQRGERIELPEKFRAEFGRHDVLKAFIASGNIVFAGDDRMVK